jgi:hypothetical protein
VGSDRPSQSESTCDKVSRELHLVAQGLGGFGDAVRVAATNHKTETLIEGGTAVALGIGLAAVRRLPGVGAPVAAAISTGLFCATIKNFAKTGFETVRAFSDSWTSADHFQQNKQIVRRDLGQFAFDSAVMAGAAGLSGGLMRGFGPATFRSTGQFRASQRLAANALNETTEAIFPLSQTLAAAQTIGGDAGTLAPAPMYAHSRVPVREVFSINDGAGKSHWMERSWPDIRYPSLRGTIDVDIAVVGGGTGSIMAAALAAKGYKVALVDAGRIAGENATLSGMAGISTRYLDEATTVTASELGTAKTKRIMDISKSGQRWLQGQARRVGAYQPAISYLVSPNLADLESEAKLVTKLDSDTRFISDDRIKSLIPQAAGAIAIHREGQIDPVRLAVQSIARERIRSGSRLQVFEHSPVLSIAVDSRARPLAAAQRDSVNSGQSVITGSLIASIRS